MSILVEKFKANVLSNYDITVLIRTIGKLNISI